MNNKDQIAWAVGALKGLKRGKVDPEEGICANLDTAWKLHHHVGDNYWRVYLKTAMYAWPERFPACTDNPSGVYPVGGRQEFLSEMSNGTLWENTRRRALVDFLIEYFTKVLEGLE